MDRPATHALIIGIGHYPYGHAFGVPDLNSTIASARVFRDCLQSVTFSNRPLCPPDCLAGENTTMEGIYDALSRWTKQVAAVEGSLGILYIAGHGIRHGDSDILLCSDFGLRPDQPWAGATDISATCDAIVRKVKHDVLILVDTCRSQPSGDLPMPHASPLLSIPSGGELAHGYCSIFSTREGDEARGHFAGHSWFMEAILQAMRGYCASRAPDGSAAWTIDTSLFEQSVSEVIEVEARRAGEIQASTRGGSRHFPLIEMGIAPQVEVVRRAIERTNELRQRFAQIVKDRSENTLLRSDIVEVVHSVAANNGRGLVWLLGPPGSGKSTAISQIAAASAGCIAVFVSKTSGLHSLREIKAYILEELERWLTDTGRAHTGMDRWSYVAPSSQPRLLLIDGVDEADQLPGEASDLGLPYNLPKGVVVLLGMRGVKRPSLPIPCFQREYRLDRENGRQRDLVAQFIDAEAAAMRADEIQAAVESSEGNFLHARLIMEMARAFPHDINLARAEAAKSLEEIIAMVMNHAVYSAASPPLTQSLVKVLSVVAEPPTSVFLAALTGYSTHAVDTAMAGVAQGLIAATEQNGVVTWRFSHSKFATFAYRMYGGREFEAWLVDALNNFSRLSHGAYAPRWHSYHLRRIGHVGELREMIMRRSWIESQLSVDPEGGLIRADFDNLNDLSGSHVDSVSLVEAFLVAFLRSSANHWGGAVGSDMMDVDTLRARLRTKDDAIHLLHHPAISTIGFLDELIQSSPRSEVERASPKWLAFASITTVEHDKAGILGEIVPYLPDSLLQEMFHIIQGFSDRESLEKVIPAALDTLGVRIVNGVAALATRSTDARAVIASWLAFPAGRDPAVIRSLAEIFMYGRHLAYQIVDACLALFSIATDDAERAHLLRSAARVAVDGRSESSLEAVFEAASASQIQVPADYLPVDMDDWLIGILVKQRGRSRALDRLVLEYVLSLESIHARLRALASFLCTSDYRTPSIATRVVADGQSLKNHMLRNLWLIAALTLNETTDLGSSEGELHALIALNASVQADFPNTELLNVPLGKAHPTTSVAITSLLKWLARRGACVVAEKTNWRLACLCVDHVALGSVLGRSLASGGYWTLGRAPDLISTRMPDEVLEVAGEAIRRTGSSGDSLYGMLVLCAMGLKDSRFKIRDFLARASLESASRPRWQWVEVLDLVETSAHSERGSWLEDVRSQILGALPERDNHAQKALPRSALLKNYLEVRRSALERPVAVLIDVLIAQQRLDRDDIDWLRGHPALLRPRLHEAWEIMGRDTAALKEVAALCSESESEVRALLLRVAVDGPADAARAAMEMGALANADPQYAAALFCRVAQLVTQDPLELGALAGKLSFESLDLGHLIGGLHKAGVDDSELYRQVLGMEWSPQAYFYALEQIERYAPGAASFMAEQLADRFVDAPADFDALTMLTQLLENERIRPLVADEQWRRLRELNFRWSIETRNEDMIKIERQVSSLRLLPWDELEQAELMVSQGVCFEPAALHSLWQRSLDEDVDFRTRVATVMSHVRLWGSTNYYYEASKMVGLMGRDVRDDVILFLTTRFRNEDDPNQAWHAASGLSLVMSDAQIVEVIQNADRGPLSTWTPHVLLRLSNGHSGSVCSAACDAVFRIAERALDELGPKGCIEHLVYVESHRTEILDLIRKLPTVDFQMEAITTLRREKCAELELVRQCGTPGMLPDYILGNITEEGIKNNVDTVEFLPILRRLGMMEFEKANRLFDSVLEEMLPHIEAEDVKVLYRSLVSACIDGAVSSNERPIRV
jgi:hypothetical protein